MMISWSITWTYLWYHSMILTMILHMISWKNLWYHRLARCTEYHMICVYDIILNQHDIIYHIQWYVTWYHFMISYMISCTHMIWYCLWYHIWYHIMISQWVQRCLRSPLQRQGLCGTLKHAFWEHNLKKKWIPFLVGSDSVGKPWSSHIKGRRLPNSPNEHT